MTNPVDWRPDQGELLKADLLLYIEPILPVSDEPIVDEVTGKITSAFHLGESNGNKWRGIHACPCGAHSDNTDYILPSGHQTNSLAIHYVALHRAEIPPEQLELIGGFDLEPTEPSEIELQKPKRSRIYYHLPSGIIAPTQDFGQE